MINPVPQVSEGQLRGLFQKYSEVEVLVQFIKLSFSPFSLISILILLIPCLYVILVEFWESTFSRFWN